MDSDSVWVVCAYASKIQIKHDVHEIDSFYVNCYQCQIATISIFMVKPSKSTISYFYSYYKKHYLRHFMLSSSRSALKTYTRNIISLQFSKTVNRKYKVICINIFRVSFLRVRYQARYRSCTCSFKFMIDYQVTFHHLFSSVLPYFAFSHIKSRKPARSFILSPRALV